VEARRLSGDGHGEQVAWLRRPWRASSAMESKHSSEIIFRKGCGRERADSRYQVGEPRPFVQRPHRIISDAQMGKRK
jgi:hypothetical protein